MRTRRTFEKCTESLRDLVTVHTVYYFPKTFISFSRGKSIHPFCNKVKQDPLQTECTDDRSSVALCNLVKHPQPLPKKYQVGIH